MELTQLFTKCHAYRAVQSSVDLMPATQPAVYAFFDILHLDHTNVVEDQIDRFLTHHGRHMDIQKDNWPYKVDLSFRGNPGRFRGEGLKLLKALTPDQKKTACETLSFLSFLSDPLYIGKTDDVRIRFRAHHDSDFLFVMKQRYQRDPSEFLFLAYFCEYELTRVIESILIQAFNPPFCEQKC